MSHSTCSSAMCSSHLTEKVVYFFTHFFEYRQNSKQTWPIEYGQRDAMSVLSITLNLPGSFYFFSFKYSSDFLFWTSPEKSSPHEEVMCRIHGESDSQPKASIKIEPCKWAILGIQPRQAFSRLSPSWYLTATIWETPKEHHLTEHSLPIELWEKIIF